MRKLLLFTVLAVSTTFASAAGVAVGVIGPGGGGGGGGPQTTTVFSGDQVSLTGTVAPGVTEVEFEVKSPTGTVIYNGFDDPDDSGKVEFSWFPLYDGTFTVTAFPYTNGVRGNAQLILITNSVRPDASGFITGGGWFTQDGARDTYGFVAQVLGNGSIKGSLEFQDHSGLNFRSTSVDWVYAPSALEGYFSGYTKMNGAGSYRFFVHVKDKGEPGTSDEFTMWVYDAAGDPIFTYSNVLAGGNIQIHKR
jgi:hypothetical protein